MDACCNRCIPASIAATLAPAAIVIRRCPVKARLQVGYQRLDGIAVQDRQSTAQPVEVDFHSASPHDYAVMLLRILACDCAQDSLSPQHRAGHRSESISAQLKFES